MLKKVFKLSENPTKWSVYVFSMVGYILVWGLPFFSISELNSQEISPIQNYDYQQYLAGTQNWSITQADNKHLFFGNNNGLLEFDGTRWSQYQTPNGTIVRSVYAEGESVYSGCYMDFGFWKRDAVGQLEYTSLSDRLTVPMIEDEHFWSIRGYRDWVLFQSLDRIYLYNKSSEDFRTIDFRSTRGLNYELGDQLFFQHTNKGLFEIRNGRMELISDHELIKEHLITGMYKFEGSIVLILERGQFLLMDDKGIRKMDTMLSLDEDLLIYTTAQLSNGDFVLGTVSNGYIRMNREGRVIERVDQETGLKNNTVLSMFQDEDTNLWLGLDNGISNINIDSAFKEYFDSKGKLGLVYSSIVFKDFLYLGTNQGLFAKRWGSSAPFELVEGTNGQVWDLNEIDDQLFCAHTAGTFLINGLKSQLIFRDSGTWQVKEIPGRDKLLLQGNYDGLSILEKTDNGWEFRNKITGFDISCRFLETLNGRDFYVNHEFKGLFKIEIDEEFKVARQVSFKEPLGIGGSLVEFNGQLLYASDAGVYTIESGSFDLLKNEDLSDHLYLSEDPNKGRLIVDRANNRLWSVTEKAIQRLEYSGFDGALIKEVIPLSTHVRSKKGLHGFENIQHIREELYLIGLLNGYVLVDLSKLDDPEFEVQLQEVASFNSRNEKRRHHPGNSLLLDSHENTIRFSFGVPTFDRYRDAEFQFILKGFDQSWSDWSTSAEATYSNLPFGDYEFQINARIGGALSKEMIAVPINIKRPWYLSTLAILSYFVAFILFLLLVHRSYRRYYKKQQAKLMEENRQALELAELEKEQALMKMRNNQLRAEIEHKNRELASTAMNLVHKNEVLHNIKKDLLNHPDSFSKQDVVKVIDKNIDGNKDWEQFKKTFNETDKDFLKIVHKKHPNLTPNDLKLCVYLRLNLSSKEIAPLLNISVRSVEIKRYRLRKKLGLEHEKSLVEYILEI